MNKLSGIYFWCVVILFTSFIATTFGFGIYLFPAIAAEMIDDLGFTYTQMGVTTGAVHACFLFFALASGFFTNLVGAIRVIKISIMFCALSLCGLIWANNFLVVSICLILLGGCASSVWVPMIDICQKYIDRSHQGRVFGLMSSGTSYGVFVNSFLIAYLLTDYGWRSVWGATFCIVTIICIIAFFILKKLENMDDECNESKREFIPVESLSWREKLKSLPLRQTSIILFMMFLTGLSCTPFQTYFSLFLIDERGVDTSENAIAWRLIGAVGMIGGFLMGWVADRLTVRWALAIVYFFLSTSVVLLLNFEGVIWILYSLSLLFGLSFYAIYGLAPAYISHMYKKGTAILVFAFANVASGLGGILGNALGGWAREEYGTFQWIYIIVLGASAIALLLCFFMKSEKEDY